MSVQAQPSSVDLDAQNSVKAISCENCRSRKRRCDRLLPCKYCVRTRRPCRYDAVKSTRRNAREAFKRDRSDDSPIAQDVQANNNEETVKEYICQSSFVNVLFTFWINELDFMYDLVQDTEATHLWARGELNGAAYPNYVALLASIFALVAQLRARDFDALLDNSFGSHAESSSLMQSAIRLAKHEVEVVMESPRDHCPSLPEHFQAHFLLCAFYKNAGQIEQYRAILAQSISYFFTASFHNVDAYDDTDFNRTQSRFPASAAPSFVQRLTPNQRNLVRRLFWSYFVCDRLYAVMGGTASSYMINASHCNVWLVSPTDGHRRSVQDICQGGQTDTSQAERIDIRSEGLPTSDFEHGKGSISAYMEAATDIAAASSRCTDLVARMRSSRMKSSSKSLEQMFLEQICSIEAEVDTLRQRYCSLDFRDGRDNLTSLRPMGVAQRHVLRLTVLQLQNDLAGEVAKLLYGLSTEMASWLEARQISIARTLLKEGLIASMDVLPRAMGWIFFLHYIAEPVRGLTDALQGVHRNDVSDEARETLLLIIKGRNLLCLIAQQSSSPLATTYAERSCKMLADTFFNSEAVRSFEALGDKQDKSLEHDRDTFQMTRRSVLDFYQALDADKFSQAFIRLRALELAEVGKACLSSDHSPFSSISSNPVGQHPDALHTPTSSLESTAYSEMHSNEGLEDKALSAAWGPDPQGYGPAPDNYLYASVPLSLDQQTSAALNLLFSLPSPTFREQLGIGEEVIL